MRSGDTRFQAALLRQAGLYRNGHKTFLTTRGTVMVIRKQNSTKPGRRKEQRYSTSTEVNGNNTEETQYGSSQIPPHIRVGQKNGQEWNKQIQWSQAERKKVLWCFMYIKEKTLERTIRKHMNCGETGIQ